MYYAVIDVGCSECGESSNLVGLFTSEQKARDALIEYRKLNGMETDTYDHEFYIYKISELDKIYNNSYEHLVEEIRSE